MGGDTGGQTVPQAEDGVVPGYRGRDGQVVGLGLAGLRHELAVSFVAFFGSFALIRTQTTIGDRAFLRSMIPHHSGAILMCQEASLSDPEIVKLCGNIIKSQREEIDQMKAILARSSR